MNNELGSRIRSIYVYIIKFSYDNYLTTFMTCLICSTQKNNTLYTWKCDKWHIPKTTMSSNWIHCFTFNTSCDVECSLCVLMKENAYLPTKWHTTLRVTITYYYGINNWFFHKSIISLKLLHFQLILLFRLRYTEQNRNAFI